MRPTAAIRPSSQSTNAVVRHVDVSERCAAKRCRVSSGRRDLSEIPDQQARRAAFAGAHDESPGTDGRSSAYARAAASASS